MLDITKILTRLIDGHYRPRNPLMDFSRWLCIRDTCYIESNVVFDAG